MIKNQFRFLKIVVILIIAPLSIFSQNNYSQSTIEKLHELRENVNIAFEKDDSLSISRAYYKLALKFDYIGESDSCDYFYRKALSIANNIKNSKAIAVISNSLATSYSDKGLHDEAEEIYSEVVDRFLSLKDTSAAAGVMLNLSAEYVDIGKYEKALEIALNALDFKLSVADSSNIAAYYVQIGVLFNSVGNTAKWIEYIQIANSLAKQNTKYGDFYRRMDILNELGAYYLGEEDNEKAECYYDTLYTQSSKNDYVAGITSSLSNLIPILKKQNRYSDALEFAQTAFKLSESSKKTYKIITSLIEIAELNILLSKPRLAEKTLLKAMEMASKFNFPNELITVYNLLSEINSESKNYAKAYFYTKKYQTLKDSIEGKNTKQIIAELETKYQTEKKDNQIELLNKENLIQEDKIAFQNRTVIGLILFCVLVITLFILFYTQSKLKAQNRVLNIHQKLLRSQMNPHFIFNALIAIQNYILKNKKFEASDYLAQFASLMRSILESSRDDFILLSREIELLEYYVSLQQLRFEDSFRFNLEIDNNIDVENLQIPPMLIQPFIENAVEHGLRKTIDADKILSVKYILDNNSLNIYIEDNGIGIEKSLENMGKKHQSYAMEITKERLMNITKIYKENIHIVIQDLSQHENRRGTQIKFIIPLKLMTRNEND